MSRKKFLSRFPMIFSPNIDISE